MGAFAFGPWCEYIVNFPGQWAEQVAGAGHAAAAHARREREAARRSQEVIDAVRLHGVVVRDPARGEDEMEASVDRDGLLGIPPAPAEVGPSWRCADCGAELGSKRGWLSHRARVHDYRSEARAYVQSGVCEACLRDFHDRPRALAHLRDSKVCLGTLRRCREPHTGVENEGAGRGRSGARS